VRVAATSILVTAAALSGSAHGQSRAPVEHEPIPPDPANDLMFGLRLDGDLPAAISTPSGLVGAPDPREALPPEATPGTPAASPSLAGQDVGPLVASHYVPDSDTRRPSALPYSDPFVPSTAPWKRLVAFDAVLRDFSLGVHDPKLISLPTHEKARTDESEELFFGDLVVDLQANQPTRIPSVGPGARVVHARLGIGADDLDFELLRDGADNWFIRTRKSGRARLVLELSIARAVFGGPFGDVPPDMRFVRWGSELPVAVQHDAALVAAHIGVPRASTRETIEALVEYFRGFSESSDPLPNDRSVYLALALSQHGVCRHRAYAFMVTATSLGIRSRVVMNEAHAWVEVHDGHLWKRVDLGGAGTILDESTRGKGPTYAPPPDPFKWPAGAKRGDDLGRTASGSSSAASGGSGSGGGTGGTGGTGGAPDDPTAPSSTAPGQRASGAGTQSRLAPDTRPTPTVTVELTEASATRGASVHLRGDILADGVPCAHAVVVLTARETKTGDVSRLGELATDDRGAYSGTLVVPATVGLGDYEVFATTPGDARCGVAVSR